MDTFSNYFSFNTVKYKDAKARTAHLNQFKNVYQRSSNSHDIIFIISDTSVKNNIVTSISYIQRKHNIIRKTVYHTMNISSTEAKLFIIRCGISHVKIINSGLNFYFSLFILFYFSFLFIYFLEQLRLGFISHAVTSVTS